MEACKPHDACRGRSVFQGLTAVSMVQATVQRLIEVRQTSNRNITNELRQVRDYKNPDFLQKMVKHFGVRDKGSCFPKDVFDPEALPKEDFYTAYVPAYGLLIYNYHGATLLLHLHNQEGYAMEFCQTHPSMLPSARAGWL